MQFYFIRHAQSVNNRIYLETGASNGRLADPPLTDIGLQQAACLADFLSRGDPDLPDNLEHQYNGWGFGLTHLYSSLMERAAQTATAVADKLDMPITAWPEVHEVGGVWLPDVASGERIGKPGHNRDYLSERYPRLRLPDSLGAAGWWSRPYEAVEERPQRAQRVVEQLLARHGGTDDRVAVVSHGGFYNNFLYVLLNLSATADIVPAAGQVWFNLGNTAVSRIDFVEEYARIVYLNRADFLPRELTTRV
jgi:2,3-bisphosphoglycerate-dependent phosphoglycerate mutase